MKFFIITIVIACYKESKVEKQLDV